MNPVKATLSHNGILPTAVEEAGAGTVTPKFALSCPLFVFITGAYIRLSGRRALIDKLDPAIEKNDETEKPRQTGLRASFTCQEIFRHELFLHLTPDRPISDCL
jgi:hypothetical protein